MEVIKDFYIIDFSKNTKGNILNNLSFEEKGKETIKCSIKYFN